MKTEKRRDTRVPLLGMSMTELKAAKAMIKGRRISKRSAIRRARNVVKFSASDVARSVSTDERGAS